jgi:hypothetical protein
MGKSRLGLRQRPLPRILLIASSPVVLPSPGEVPIEVNAVGVLAAARSHSVRIEVVDHPQVDPADRTGASQHPSDLDAGGLVPMDTADDEDSGARARRADLDRDDRPPVGRAPNDHRMLTSASSQRRHDDPNDEPRPSDRQPAAEASERHGASN